MSGWIPSSKNTPPSRGFLPFSFNPLSSFNRQDTYRWLRAHDLRSKDILQGPFAKWIFCDSFGPMRMVATLISINLKPLKFSVFQLHLKKRYFPGFSTDFVGVVLAIWFRNPAITIWFGSLCMLISSFTGFDMFDTSQVVQNFRHHGKSWYHNHYSVLVLGWEAAALAQLPHALQWFSVENAHLNFSVAHHDMHKLSKFHRFSMHFSVGKKPNRPDQNRGKKFNGYKAPPLEDHPS